MGIASRIRAHLGMETVTGVSKCEKVPSDVIMQFSQAEAQKMRKKKDGQSQQKCTQQDMHRCHLLSVIRNKQSCRLCSRNLVRRTDRAITRMCYSTGVSFNIGCVFYRKIGD
jgi:hypothetical protein